MKRTVSLPSARPAFRPRVISDSILSDSEEDDEEDDANDDSDATDEEDEEDADEAPRHVVILSAICRKWSNRTPNALRSIPRTRTSFRSVENDTHVISATTKLT